MQGRHSIKFGYEFLAIRTEVLDMNPLYGQDTYAGNSANPPARNWARPPAAPSPATPPATTSPTSTFGLPSTINSGSNPVINLRQHVHSLYVQDDYRVNPKLTVNMGLRWEFATPLYERDNNWSNFDPDHRTRWSRATGGSLYNRSLVHPDYKDFGPRLGLAYSIDTEDGDARRLRHQLHFFNRPGSAQEGINAPQALFGVLNQSIPAGGPVPAAFLTTQNSFTTGIANPSAFNPVNSNVDLHSAGYQWPYVQNWFFSVQREIAKDTVIEWLTTETTACGCPSSPITIRLTPNHARPRRSASRRSARPIPTFGPITWVDPAGDNHYNGLSGARGASLRQRPVLPEFVHLGQGDGRFRAGSGILRRLLRSQSAEHPRSGGGARPVELRCEIEQRHQRGVSASFGKGRKFGANMNPVLRRTARRLGAEHHQHRPYRYPLDVIYAPSTVNDVTGLSNDYRGQAFLRPNVTGSAPSQSKSQMLNTYFAGYTFTTPSPRRLSAIWAATLFARPDSNNGISRPTRPSASTSASACSSAPSSSIS